MSERIKGRLPIDKKDLTQSQPLNPTMTISRTNKVVDPGPCSKWHLTVPLEVSQALEKYRTYGSGRPAEVLEAHVAQLSPVKVKVLEGNVGGINLVHV